MSEPITQPYSSRTPQDNLSPRDRRAMIAILLAVSLATLDTAIANTALPAIAHDLHASPAASVWIVNAYQLATVATLLPFAALGDLLGHRRTYLAGVVVFMLASLGCALAPSLPALALARALQGVGGSAIMSVNIALIRFIYPPHRLGRGVGLNALIVGVAFAIGPSIASLILSIGSWPWLFAVNVPIGLLTLAVGATSLPRTPLTSHGFDPVAALLNVVAFASLIFALGEAAQRASPSIVLLTLACALIFGTLLVRREARHPAPMLPVDLFRRPMFTLSTITAVCSFAAQGLAFVSLPFYFESVLMRSQVETGFLMTPWPVVVAAFAPIAGRLSDRYSPGMLGAIGLAVLSLGMASLALLPAHPHVLDISFRMALCGAGFGFFQSPNLKALMSSAPPERSGGASGIVATARLIGQASGAALVALCFSVAGHHGPTLALALGAAFAGAGCLASGMRLFAADRPASRSPTACDGRSKPSSSM
jgi:MFS transporter, DHA2 family, multidrug resistance protein